ncbi:MAG: GIY-YIG nuclease family protein [Proteobacteria bacterium]|nr:GIY-YIG nuclease family protein [Pseudomonadota bacterium]
MPAWFYILRLRSSSLYIGTTTNLEKRYKEHNSRVVCRS